MTETKWTATKWLDEVTPELVDHPDRLIHGDGSRWCIAAPDHVDGEDHYSMPVVPGQIVNFCAHRRYGDHDIRFAEDGSYTIAETWPADANCFFWREHEVIGDSVAEMVAFVRDYEPIEPGTYSITVYHWSDGTDFEFQIADGFARFVEVTKQ